MSAIRLGLMDVWEGAMTALLSQCPLARLADQHGHLSLVLRDPDEFLIFLKN